jgi:hypothetical protein
MFTLMLMLVLTGRDVVSCRRKCATVAPKPPASFVCTFSTSISTADIIIQHDIQCE